MNGLLLAFFMLSLLFADEKKDRQERQQQKQERQQPRQERRQERQAARVDQKPQRQRDFQKGIERTPTVQRREDRRRDDKVKIPDRVRTDKPRRVEDFKEISKGRHRDRERSDELSRHIRNRRSGSNNWFRDDFFDRHHRHGFHHRGVNWWGRSYWDNIAYWLPWGWSYPIYYDYGGTPVVIQNYITPETVPAPVTTEDWMPLGVFAAGRSEQEIAFSNFYFQLAVNNMGAISGTFYNSAPDQTYPLVGQIDSTTQQASWKLEDDPNSLIMVTGIYNLTQDIAPTQVYFPDGTVQDWTLVRMQDASY